MRRIARTIAGILMVALGGGTAGAQGDLAMNNPDQQAWQLFATVNAGAASAGNNDVLFETWARDADIFRPNPVWPAAPPRMALGPRALSLLTHPGLKMEVVPGGNNLVSEETRRNRAGFDFIVNNNLYKVSGLKAAFAAGKPLAFPVDALEVKANWVEVGQLKTFNGFSGTPAQAAKIYHLNSAAGKQYALVSFHIISKLVPNWTWATFEHKDNPAAAT